MKTADHGIGKPVGKHRALPCTPATGPTGGTTADPPAAAEHRGRHPMPSHHPDPESDPATPARAAPGPSPATAERPAAEAVVTRSCAWCGREMAVTQRTGRPRRYCSKNCRNRASEARTIAPRLAIQIAAGHLATAPVREVVERTVPVTPTDAHGWSAVLGELARQLADPATQASREHWHHRRILAALPRPPPPWTAPTPEASAAAHGADHRAGRHPTGTGEPPGTRGEASETRQESGTSPSNRSGRLIAHLAPPVPSVSSRAYPRAVRADTLALRPA
jgi:hypothetical protein